MALLVFCVQTPELGEKMIDKLEDIKKKYDELNKLISDPEVINDNQRWQKLMIEHSEITPIVEKYNELLQVKEDLAGTKEVFEEAKDPEVIELAQMEIGELEERLEELDLEIQKLLIPKDPNDGKNVIMEIRAGAGGDEAGLFASELLRMYLRYAENNHWKTEVLDMSESGVGGIKEVSVQISGKNVYSRLKYESGTHRVQRVPETESGGRIHTSTATVAVLPEAEEVDVTIQPNDLKIDVYRSSGHGGQSVNTTDSAVRITHLPTGTVVTCQDGKSQLMNKEKAMIVLRSRLYEQEVAEQNRKIASQRKLQVGTGDRSQKIRTYNFPQGRITDHRINKSVYKMEAFMLGEIDEMLDALITDDQAEKLRELSV